MATTRVLTEKQFEDGIDQLRAFQKLMKEVNAEKQAEIESLRKEVARLKEWEIESHSDEFSCMIKENLLLKNKLNNLRNHERVEKENAELEKQIALYERK